MTNFTDSEVTIIQNALVATRQALEPDNDPQAKEIIKKIVECERILSGKESQAVGTSSVSSTEMNRYFNTKQTPVKSVPLPMGTSATVIQKTKALFTMFHPSDHYYEPEPIGASIASKIVAGHKTQKIKSLFEMFNLS